MIDNECFDNCPNGTFKKGNICDICDSSCKRCVDAPTKCTGCPNGQYLCNNDCLEKSNDRTFRDGDECVTECKPDQFLYDGICYNQCPMGTYSSGILCKECDPTCKECSYKSTSCTNCNEDSFLLDSK